MEKGYEGWAIVELMGHRRLAGRVSEVSQYGAAMLRLDVPDENGAPMATQFYGGASLYCVTPTTEEIARAVAASSRPAPVQRWELPAPKPATPTAANAGSYRVADPEAGGGGFAGDNDEDEEDEIDDGGEEYNDNDDEGLVEP